jgi:hypothetical protein
MACLVLYPGERTADPSITVAQPVRSNAAAPIVASFTPRGATALGPDNNQNRYLPPLKIISPLDKIISGLCQLPR